MKYEIFILKAELGSQFHFNGNWWNLGVQDKIYNLLQAASRLSYTSLSHIP